MPTKVVLHVYDVGEHEAVSRANKVLRALGTGAFHAAVEVYGKEWSYGYIAEGTGLFSTEPGQCEFHKYREAIELGETMMSSKEVEDLIVRLEREWPGEEYDFLRMNCCHFSDEMSIQLGVGPIPKWVKNLAGAGATLQNGVDRSKSAVSTAAIMAAAKAGQIDEKFEIRGKTRAAMQKTKEFNEKYHVTGKVNGAGAKVNEAGRKAAEKATQAAHKIDQRLDLSGKASHATQVASTVANKMDEKLHITVGASAAAEKATAVAGNASKKGKALLGKVQGSLFSGGYSKRSMQEVGAAPNAA